VTSASARLHTGSQRKACSCPSDGSCDVGSDDVGGVRSRDALPGRISWLSVGRRGTRFLDVRYGRRSDSLQNHYDVLGLLLTEPRGCPDGRRHHRRVGNRCIRTPSTPSSPASQSPTLSCAPVCATHPVPAGDLGPPSTSSSTGCAAVNWALRPASRSACWPATRHRLGKIPTPASCAPSRP